MLKFISIFFILFVITASAQNNPPAKPVKVAVIGLTHAHVGWILGRKNDSNMEMIAVVEPDRQLAEARAKSFGFSTEMIFPSMEALMKKMKPDAVLAFNSIYEHLQTVEFFAPLGIHVMVEKPLAVSVDHASKMQALAKKHNIHLLTNYETTWYGSNKKAWEAVNDDSAFGPIKKLVFHTGHQGPKEIGCGPEFLNWLTDPKLNGGGALMDFGCYGANLSTWLTRGEEPVSVTAVMQQLKPLVYPRVDDDATIIVQYKDKQAILQPSWNWPYSVKDMEVYGKNGFVFCLDGTNMLTMKNGRRNRDTVKAPPLPKGLDDPFAYFARVITGQVKPTDFDLSALPNNYRVVQILEAAKQSAKTGKAVVWKEFYKKGPAF